MLAGLFLHTTWKTSTEAPEVRTEVTRTSSQCFVFHGPASWSETANTIQVFGNIAGSSVCKSSTFSKLDAFCVPQSGSNISSNTIRFKDLGGVGSDPVFST